MENLNSRRRETEDKSAWPRSDWKKAGVRSLKDVLALDEKRRAGQAGQRRQQEAAARPKNQFHNFEQRDTDYNALVMEQVRGWLGEDRKE